MKYLVRFDYDEEACVWVATSDDVVGLVLEDDSLDRLKMRVGNAIPELLEINGKEKPVQPVRYSAEKELVALYG